MISTPEGLEHFLKTMFHESKKRPPDEVVPFVTISRETGAGGHSLAEEMLRQAAATGRPSFLQGWRLFDQEVLELAAANKKLRIYLPAWKRREYRPELEDALSHLLANTSPQSEVIGEMFGVMRGLASRGKVILLGRGGAPLTRGFPGGVHVRLVAPRPVRVARMQKLMNVDARRAEEFVVEQDQSRAALVKRYFDRDIADPLLYDAVWNTESLPLGLIAASVLRLAEERASQERRAAACAEDRVVL